MAVVDSNANSTIDEELLTEKIAAEVYTVVCQNGGVMDVLKATSALGSEGVAYVDDHGFYPLVSSSLRDVLKLEFEQPSNRAQLRATVKVELCTEYKNSNCINTNCRQLHVCPFFIRGNCRFGNRCRYHHNFEDVHEREILKEHKLDGLDHASLVTVLRRELFGLHIEVCPEYNSLVGCPIGNACRKYHICTSFAMGGCNEGARCHKSHTLQEEMGRILSLQRLDARAYTAGMLSRIFRRQMPGAVRPTVDEICGFHLKGSCQYGDRCNRHKHNLPYLWQISVSVEGGAEKWVNLMSSFSQEIERDYCDVSKDSSIEINICKETAEEQGILLFIHFADMVAKDDSETYTAHIRRLSTASWLKASTGDTFATRWTWYWMNDQNQWTPFNGGEANHISQQNCDSDNEKLEESFLSGAENFSLPLNQNSYNIDFKNLQQTNMESGKVRRIRRRPTKYIGEQELVGIASRANQRTASSLLPMQNNVTLPSEWTTMSANEVTLPLDPSSPEYIQGAGEFRKTLNGRTIHKIERIQNVDLWEPYSRKLSKISEKLGRPAEIRQLFHGTGNNSAAAICQQGFDWRLCGVHGTAFGKGSYFAVNASYSDRYAGNSPQGHKMMFLAKVIVGTYVVGNSSTVRPPPRNPINPHELHHSCVDNPNNPTIFVIFDNDQAYPELLITYS